LFERIEEGKNMRKTHHTHVMMGRRRELNRRLCIELKEKSSMISCA
jgi:hypothetical protein